MPNLERLHVWPQSDSRVADRLGFVVRSAMILCGGFRSQYLRARDPVLRSVQIVSFNSNEERAVDLLLDDIGASGIWVRHGERALRRLYGTDTWRIEHAPLRAQGNVIAAAQLAEFFLEHRNQDFIVFYGCAGALRPDRSRSVFLVQRANYLSLGTVSQDAVERPSPSRISGSAISIRATTCFRLNECCFPDDCRAREPGFVHAYRNSSQSHRRNGQGGQNRAWCRTDTALDGSPHPLYAKEEWTYGQALALMNNLGVNVLVEMEFMGSALSLRPYTSRIRWSSSRTTTDTLRDHADSADQQRALLERGRRVLGHVVAALFDRFGAPT